MITKTLGMSMLVYCSVQSVCIGENRVGMGLSLQGGNTVYLPVQLGHFLIEPTVSWFDSDNKREFVTNTDQNQNTYKMWSAGIGSFINKNMAGNINIYLGARMGYRVQEYSFSRRSTYLVDAFQEKTDVISEKDSQNGYYVNPTVGLNYFFAPHFSVGGEISYMYSRLDGERFEFNSLAGEDTQEKFNRESNWDFTHTQLIVRLFF